MPDNVGDTGTVSWRIFNDLYESQYDLFRKLRFFVKTGLSGNNERLALEMIDEFLAEKQDELEMLRRKGLDEWKSSGQATRELARQSEGSNTELAQCDTGKPVLLLSEKMQPGRNSFWNRLRANNGGSS